MVAAADIQPVSLEELQPRPSGPRGIPLVIILGAALSAAFVLQSTPLQSANDRSRWCTVYSLVEEGTWQIDKIDAQDGWSTIDKVRHEGHFYSSKPALLQALVAGVYWCVKYVTGASWNPLAVEDGWNLNSDTEVTARAILIVVNLIPAIISWFVINGMLVRYARGRYTKRLLLIAAIFATPLTTFLVTLNNHTVAAWAVVFSLAPALRILIDDEHRPHQFAAAGFFAAFAFVNELPALAFLGLLGLLLLRHDPRRTLLIFLPAALLPIAAAVATTYWQTGGWKPFYAFYGTEKYLYVHQGIPSYWMTPRSLDKNVDSFPVYLLHCTFGHHGIFSLTPLFLLMLPAWFVPRWSTARFRPLVWMSALLTVVVLGFYLSRTGNYNYGGNTSTLRWLMWLTPLWLLSLIPVLDRFGETRTMQWFAGLGLAIGCFSAFWSIHNPWTPPWMFTLLDRYEQLEQYKDELPDLDRTHYAWFSSLPEPPDEGAEPAWIELSGIDSTGRTLRLRLTDGGREETGRRVLFAENLASRELVEHRLLIDEETFNAGGKIDDWLLEPSADDPTARERTLTLLRGFPKTGKYRKGKYRYIITPLRDDAFEAHHAALRIKAKGADGDAYWYRCDTWYCPDLPFGVVQINLSVHRDEGNVAVSDLLLTVSGASSFPPQADPEKLRNR